MVGLVSYFNFSYQAILAVSWFVIYVGINFTYISTDAVYRSRIAGYYVLISIMQYAYIATLPAAIGFYDYEVDKTGTQNYWLLIRWY